MIAFLKSLFDKLTITRLRDLFDGNGKVKTTYLPSYVNDVLDFDNFAALPVTGETGILYCTVDTVKIYRWSGSVYVEVSPQLIQASTDLTDTAKIVLTDTIQNITALKTFSANTLAKTGTELITNLNADKVDGYDFNQSLQTTNSPTFVTAKLTNLTDGYLPYHASDASGLSNSSIYFDSVNTRTGFSTSTPSARVEVYGTGQTVANITDAGSRQSSIAIIDDGAVGGAGGFILFGNSQSKTAGSIGGAAIKYLLTSGASNTLGDLIILNRRVATDNFLTESLRITAAGNVAIGSTTATAKLDVNSDIIRLRTAKTPASASDTGNTGDIAWDNSYIYVCTATNTWKRTALNTWV